MTEEVVGQNVEDKKVEPSEIEQKAMEMGWRPKEDLEDDVSFIPAEEFVRRKPLFDKIEGQSKQIKEVTKALKALQEHHNKVKAVEYKNAVEALKAEKRVALVDGDADKLIEIDDQIADIKAQEATEKQKNMAQAAQPAPEFVAWTQKNTWYINDDELRSFADEVGVAHAKLHPDKHPEDILEYAEKRVRKAFPEKFVNQNKNKPSAVEGDNTPVRQSKKGEFELTDEERKVMNNFIRQGVLTKEEYIAELKKVRE